MSKTKIFMTVQIKCFVLSCQTSYFLCWSFIGCVHLIYNWDPKHLSLYNVCTKSFYLHLDLKNKQTQTNKTKLHFFVDTSKFLHFESFVECITYLVEGAYSRRTSDTNLSRYSIFITASYEGISYNKLHKSFMYTCNSSSIIKTSMWYSLFMVLSRWRLQRIVHLKHSVYKWH
jgi:hypothetical protein